MKMSEKSQVFLLASPVLMCKGQICSTEQNGCLEEEVQLAENQPRTLAIEYGLYCDKAYILDGFESAFFLTKNQKNSIFWFLHFEKKKRFFFLSI